MAARKPVVQMRSINVELKEPDMLALLKLSQSRGFADCRDFASELLLGALERERRG